jgi:hypothetical protein
MGEYPKRKSRNKIGTLQSSKLAGREAAVAPNSSTGVDMQEP